MPKEEYPQFSDHGDCEALTGITLEHLPRDGSIGRARRYRKGADVWSPEDRANSIFFLRRGQVSVMAGDRDGHEVIVRLIEPREPFGELCFCGERESVRRTTARAVVESEAVEIRLPDFLAYLQEDTGALKAFVFTLCVRLGDAEHRMEVLAHRGAEERLGKLLLQMAASGRVKGGGRGGKVDLTVSHDELAQRAAMSRPHVTVTMGMFRRHGLVRYGRGQPLVVDVPALEAYLSGEPGRDGSVTGSKGGGGRRKQASK